MDSDIIVRYYLFEFAALSAFVLYVFFSYCDGFGLSIQRKLLWAAWFLALCFWSQASYGYLNVSVIILCASMIAFVMARLQRAENLQRK